MFNGIKAGFLTITCIYAFAKIVEVSCNMLKNKLDKEEKKESEDVQQQQQ